MPPYWKAPPAWAELAEHQDRRAGADDADPDHIQLD